jgi:hypothetical protein
MGEVARKALRAGWSGTLFSASSRDYGILVLRRTRRVEPFEVIEAQKQNS